MNEIEAAYDSLDKNLENKLDSDWEPKDNEEADPTWLPISEDWKMTTMYYSSRSSEEDSFPEESEEDEI